MKPQQYRLISEQVRANALAAVQALPISDAGFSRITHENKKAKIWVVRIEEEKQTRTHRQNRYLWGVVYKTIIDNDPGIFASEQTDAVLKQAGLTVKDVVHEFCKRRFLMPVFVAGIEVMPSTKTLEKAAFNDYVEDIRRWAAHELQIFIPDPVVAGYADIGR
ncbi:hypothetical protein [Suttonella ornithocola]|uniref:Uncharacterized protein n=1 Tax=Suttonella ornithocola TaxID=279832 RepID=A0A380MRN6_9GAMM|nr:hypothetical protein [Suttonella ornithocola]SUO95225.1 Uncharacterised protein [Suttonella ornithocola]